MPMSKETKPSAAAMRAARRISDSLHWLNVHENAKAADIIDAEFAPLVEALRAIVDCGDLSLGSPNPPILDALSDARKALEAHDA